VRTLAPLMASVMFVVAILLGTQRETACQRDVTQRSELVHRLVVI
jgi:hypothetical protein